MSLYLSIVIPAYNETVNFKKGVLDRVKNYLEKTTYSYEVLIVDDGSNDGSTKLLADFCKKTTHFRLISNPHLGKASALYAGVKQAMGELVLTTDFDQATPLKEIEKLLPFVDRGFDIVIGSREVKGAKREKEPFYRHLMGKVFNLVVKIFTLGGIADTQCGFKLYKTEVARKLFSLLTVYPVQKQKPIKHAFTGAVDVELLFLANKLRHRVAEVPIHWRHFSTTRVSPLRDSTKMFLDVLKIRWVDISGAYER
jgi:dolichyl-phosphate beta-glucosyltransferase